MNKERTGRLIAEARKENHMTQQELAERLLEWVPEFWFALIRCFCTQLYHFFS